MVNVGGPSKGCLTCIQRKIRCDRQRPACGQCLKSSRACGGYRDATDMMFRNQSQTSYARSIETSLSRLNIRKKTPGQEWSKSSETDSTQSRSEAPMMIRSPKLDAETGLITFFANNFICIDSNRGTNLFWMPNNFDDLLENNSTKLSIQSVGAMALARLRGSPHYLQEAQKFYGLALRNLADLWRHNVEIDEDAILIAILFLGFFEVLASDMPSSRQSWMAHLGGLGFLLNRRKEQLTNTGFGARMLLQSRSQVILNALQTKAPVTEEFRTLSQGIQRSMPPQVLHSDLADMLLIRLASLQARHRSLDASDTLVAELAALDADIDQWTVSAPPAWSFTIQLRETHSELWWEARHDLYPTPIGAHVWNKMRAARIIIYDLIQQAYQGGQNHFNLAVHRTCYEFPTVVLRHLVTDICATVPPYYYPSSASASHGAAESPPPIGTAYWLLWPLEVAGSMSEAPLELTVWIKQCLERIYETTGIVKAQLMAIKLQERIGRAVVA